MQILWSRFAKECLKEISQYYKNVAGIKTSRKIRHQIFHAIRQLAKHPELGPIEPFLKRGDPRFIGILLLEGLKLSTQLKTRTFS